MMKTDLPLSRVHGLRPPVRLASPVALNQRPAPGHRNTAPSLRVPVTPDNREMLRSLRAAEMDLWRDARVPRSKAAAVASRPQRLPRSLGSDRGESVLLGLLLIVSLGAIMQSERALRGLLLNWENLVEIVRQALT
jgi:hypothetical protein